MRALDELPLALTQAQQADYMYSLLLAGALDAQAWYTWAGQWHGPHPGQAPRSAWFSGKQ